MVNNKHAKPGNAQQAIGPLIVLIVGVAVATITMIFSGALGGQTWQIVESDINLIGANTVVNESFTSNNVSYVNLDHSWITEGTLIVATASSPGTPLELGNFTVDYTNGKILTSGDYNSSHSGFLNNTELKASYTWGADEVSSYVKSSVASSFKAQKQTGDYMPLMVLAVIITLVLGMILGMLAFAGIGNSNRGSGGVL